MTIGGAMLEGDGATPDSAAIAVYSTDRTATGTAPDEVLADEPKTHATLRRNLMRPVPGVILFVLIFGAWQLLIVAKPDWGLYFPRPSKVVHELIDDHSLYTSAAWVTIKEALFGLALGAATAIVSALLMAEWGVFERALMPLFLLIKVTPAVALLPVFIIIMGFGAGPKILLAALTILYITMINALTGFKSIEPSARELFDSVDASRWEILWHLRIPSSLPYLFAAAKVAVPLSVLGAVYAEMQSSVEGVGNVLIQASSLIDMTVVWACIFVLAFLSIVGVVIVTLIEGRALHWHSSHLRPQ